MTGARVRLGVGTRLRLDGETVQIVEMTATPAGNEVVLKDGRGRITRMSVRELLFSDRARVIPESQGPSSTDDIELASVVLGQLSPAEHEQVTERAAHVRELLTGYRSGSAELAGPGEPRPEYDPGVAMMQRYASKAAELGVGGRTLRRWVAEFRGHGEAGLASQDSATSPTGRVDPRWAEMALTVMAEHADASKPSRKMVIERTRARLVAHVGDGVVPLPSRATAYRVLEELERRHPTFRLSAKRNRDIAGRPEAAYGRLRPTRPGEYLLMDTTRLDVFALDPVTLRWVQVELSCVMDWYSRCVVGVRVTPVSTKAVDAACILYQAFRPRPAPADWPKHAVWPEHGIPAAVLIDPDVIEGAMARPAAGPAILPETIVVDHGKIYVSAHVTSVCARMGVSIQPVRLRTGRDKGPIERYFRTLREDLLQVLPGYKGPDVHSRGTDPEGEAFFYLDELEAIIIEWVATVYHLRPHSSLVDPGVPGLRMSPSQMFAHGMARAGYLEVPRDPDLGLEFLATKRRTIQHYGVEVNGRRYNGNGLNPYRNKRSDHTDGKWPFQIDPDDITRIWFRDPGTGPDGDDGKPVRVWHALAWEHAPTADMPLSEDALVFARKLAAAKYRFPDDRIAVADLLERWNLGLGTSLAERRIALRLSRETAGIDLPANPEDPMLLPSVRKALSGISPGDTDERIGTAGQAAVTGDDDDTDFDDDSDADAEGRDDDDDGGDDDFYADAFPDA